MNNEVIYLAFCNTLEESGWGVLSRYMDQELSKLIGVVNLQKRQILHSVDRIPGTVFHAIANSEFHKTIKTEGYFNAGYCFFEAYLSEGALENARMYDLILTGSSWCTDRLKDYGIANCETLIQGIDPKVWNPITQPKEAKWRDSFVIFGGGKFELRKGQDLALKAVKILQEKYKDIVLVSAWENKWPDSMATMLASPHIRFEDRGDTWEEKMATIYAMNRMAMGRLITYPLLPQRELRNVIRNTDIGLFPNRCEGGTNLSLMEYMATGKPVVATLTSGHRDVLTDDNCFPVKDLTPMELKANGKGIALWDEPNLDEIVAQIEAAYNDRDRMQQVGAEGAKSIRKLSWENTAKNALRMITERAKSVPRVFKPREREEFGKYLNDLGLTGSGVEIGVQRGEFSEILRKSWRGNVLHLVDRWQAVDGYDDVANVTQDEQDELFKSVQDRFSGDKSVNIIKLSSTDAANLFPDEHFDFIYIDADHSHEGTKADLEAWWPKLKPGGVFAGHDFLDGYVVEIGEFGVKRAVEEFAIQRGLSFNLTHETDWKSWFIRK